MSICEFIRSRDNRTLLETFAFKKLSASWPKLTSAVKSSVAIALDDAIEEGLAPYVAWANTKENAQLINTEIFKGLKKRVTKSMNGAQQDPEDTIEQVLARPRQVFDDKIEGRIEDRELEMLRERHMSAWR